MQNMSLVHRSAPAKGLGALTSRPLLRKAAPARVVCHSRQPKRQDDEADTQSVTGGVTAALAASILLAAAAVPGDALAARSGGRVGGSSFRSSAPSSAPRSQTTVRNYNNYNVSPAPPLIGGYGYGGYGYGGGISLMPTFVTPIGGGIFQFFFVAIIASTVLGVIRSLFNRRRDNDNWD